MKNEFCAWSNGMDFAGLGGGDFFWIVYRALKCVLGGVDFKYLPTLQDSKLASDLMCCLEKFEKK